MRAVIALLLIVVTCCNCSLTAYNSVFVSNTAFKMLLNSGASVSATTTSGISGSSWVYGAANLNVIALNVVIGGITFSYPIVENGLEYVVINGLINIDVSSASGNNMYINYFDTESLSVNTLMLTHV